MTLVRGLRLGPRLTLVFVLFAAALVVVLAAPVFVLGRQALLAAAEGELTSLAAEKSAGLEQWVEIQAADVDALARSPRLLDEAARLAAPGPQSAAAHDRLIQELLPHTGPGQPYLSLFVLAAQTGQVLASTDPSEEGKFREDRPYFIQGQAGSYVSDVHYSLQLQAPAMVAAAPLRAAGGQLLGVLAARLDLGALQAIVARRAAHTQSDDAYLVNPSSQFVTQPRFVTDPAVLRLGVHTEAVRRCLAGESGQAAGLDYRGVAVISGYRWLAERRMCLVVQIDQAEALAPVRAFGASVVLAGLAALTAASVTAFLLARTISRPVLALQAAAARYGQGQLSVRLPETAGGELGLLAREFNQMAASLAAKEAQLRAYAEGLEQTVAARTAAIQESEDRFRYIFDHSLIGKSITRPSGEMKVNAALCAMLGYSAEELQDRDWRAITHPDDVADSEQIVAGILAGERASARFSKRYLHKNGSVVWADVSTVLRRDPDGRPLYLMTAVSDITEVKRLEAEREQLLAELQRSNAELEQFAYVASHDLQEPLRMVASYVQLLARRYQGRLDADADDFIHFAVDGAARMQQLINDLLAYSRVGSRGHAFAPTDCGQVLGRVLDGLQIALAESGGRVTCTPLPTVVADEAQLAQLFQNLIGNALKFRGQDPPQVEVGAEPRGGAWLFWVRDNGIGIDPQFFERIFIIFQRLHTRAEYGGSGIGLAICKKIVERHGGRIWVESAPGQGSTFYFTVPDQGDRHNGERQAN